MRVRRVRVEGFRSLSSLEIELAEPTALFGENDAGIGLLLDALTRALRASEDGAPSAFSQEDLPRRASGERGEILVHLELEPSRADEWSEELHAPLRAELLGARPSRDAVHLAIRVRASGKKGVEQSETYESVDGRRSDAAALRAWRRTALPVLDLSRGLLSTTAASPARRARGSAERAERGALRSGFARWLAAQPTLDDESWEEIYPDIEHLWQELQRHLAPLTTTSGWLVSDFDLDVPRRSQRAREVPLESSRGARLALLLLAGALAQRSAEPLHPQSSPLLVLGELEAQLHPTTRYALVGFLLHLRAQVVFSTHSSQVLVHLPLSSLRRVVRVGEGSQAFGIQPRAIPRDALRKIRYHLVTRHPEALLARAWLLVEGETEAWLLPEIARATGYFLPIEGVVVIEYAQCGLAPLLRLAESLRIEWHVLSDGDAAGESYAALARKNARGASRDLRVTELPERDIETSFWRHGFAHVIERLAGTVERRARESEPSFAHRAIKKALDRHAKPQVALKLIEALGGARAPEAPPPLARCIEATIELARTRPLLQSSTSARTRPRRASR